MSLDLEFSPFQIDHIIARKHGGGSAEDNLAFACFYCNTHKGPNIAGIDPVSREVVRLFHPRRDVWKEHFFWEAQSSGQTLRLGVRPSACSGLTIRNMLLFASRFWRKGFFLRPNLLDRLRTLSGQRRARERGSCGVWRSASSHGF
jgi:hypothetical protein